MERMIYIKTQFEGFHSWKDAPDEVVFLRNSHRHVFYAIITIPVKHNDREIEFFIFQADIKEYIRNNINKHNTGSCEMIAEMIATYIAGKYNRQVMVDISEDNENGAIVAL